MGYTVSFAQSTLPAPLLDLKLLLDVCETGGIVGRAVLADWVSHLSKLAGRLAVPEKEARF